MRKLTALTTMPFARLDGSLVLEPGFDDATGIYACFDRDDLGDVPDAPSRAELVGALRDVWRPVHCYRFATPDDLAGALASLLHPLFRPVLPIAPGYLAEAPIQASGKTEFASVPCAVALGGRPTTKGYRGAARNAEEELGKTLVASANLAELYFLLDNIVGLFDSPAVARFLTSGNPGDRILGGNDLLTLVWRCLFWITANNARIGADLMSRLVRVRIDSGEARPQSIRYPFSPVAIALATRWEIINALCVLVRGWVAGRPGRQGGGRFPEWGSTVCSMVCWLRDSGIAHDAGVGADWRVPGRLMVLGEPDASLVDASGGLDEESANRVELLLALRERFGGGEFTARDVERACGLGSLSPVASVLEEWIPVGRMTSRRIGTVLRERRDAHYGGLVLRYWDGGGERSGVFAVLDAPPSNS